MSYQMKPLSNDVSQVCLTCSIDTDCSTALVDYSIRIGPLFVPLAVISKISRGESYYFRIKRLGPDLALDCPDDRKEIIETQFPTLISAMQCFEMYLGKLFPEWEEELTQAHWNLVEHELSLSTEVGLL